MLLSLPFAEFFELVQKAAFTSVTGMFSEDKACSSQQGDKGEGNEGQRVNSNC